MKTYICDSCGKNASQADKFCQSCGGKIVEKIMPEQKCPACGCAVGKNDEHCPVCGREINTNQVESFNACKKCGTEIFNDDVFCPNCGERVKNVSTPSPAPKPVYAPPVRQQGNNGTSIALIVLLVLLIIALIGAIILFIGSDRNFNSFPTRGEEVVVQATPVPYIPVTAPPVTPMPQMPRMPYTEINDPYAYLFPSNSSYISEDFLRTRTQSEVRLILNEIYARHGYSFESREFSLYFGSKQWYIPMGKSMQACEAEFNNYERVNKETIVKYEMSRGWR